MLEIGHSNPPINTALLFEKAAEMAYICVGIEGWETFGEEVIICFALLMDVSMVLAFVLSWDKGKTCVCPADV